MNASINHLMSMLEFGIMCVLAERFPLACCEV